MKERPTYILKGTLKNIEMRVAYTKEGEKEYGTADLEVKTPCGKRRTVPILTYYPTGIELLYMTKEGTKVEVFGTFTSLKGTNGTNKFFELIGKHKRQEKKIKLLDPEGVETLEQISL